MEVGAHVWCSYAEGDRAWVLAEVLKKGDDEIHLQEVDNPDNKFSRPSEIVDKETQAKKFKGVELANAKLSAEEKASGRDDDLITLPHLHEPALLHAVSERFFDGKIYTWTGPILIAVNPFQRLPLYTSTILEQYRREGLLISQGLGDGKSSLKPHIYAIADRSYRQMMGEQRKSQSILISGESGAGKTESTKIVMLYLTTLGAGMMKDQKEGELTIMERVLQSNPVLEAFGNARTLRNDNSSRFGKFIELGFSRAGNLMGAKVQTYLLEKVRVAFHASGERNYHIFYQILRGATDEQKKKFDFNEGLTQGLELPNYFHYTGQGGAPHLREFTDEEGLKYTVKAMKGLGWSQDTMDTVLSIVAGILHLGEIKFDAEEKDGVDASVVSDRKPLENAARLMGVELSMLETALTERLILARGQEIRTQLTPEKSSDARDALGKTLYGAMFLWVVDQVNASIMWKNDSDVKSSCGVLDIFGFECFAINSFEQLCINFTNEALQQQFNKFIFKMEQAEYERESIQWAFISFPDNQDCLDTIQMKKTGILAMLDDECRLPRGSDRNYANRMYDNFLPNKKAISDNTRFSATPVQRSKAIFCVRHFAGVVQYSAQTGFMEKNKDEIPLTAKNMFENAPTELVKEIFAVQTREITERAPENKSGKGKPAKSKTVGQQFKEQLNSLIESVEKTDPHYIRCLKPNDAAKPMMLTRKRLTEQLRYGGVLEAVRVARMGYPVRLPREAFFQRYRMLLPSTPENILPWSLEGEDAQKLCVKLVDQILLESKAHNEKVSKNGKLSPNEEGISRTEKIRRMQNQPMPIDFPKTDVQLGATKVFMRKPPHDALEAHRVFHQHASATVVQCWFRGMKQFRRFNWLSEAALIVQRVYRGFKGRERWWTLRRAVAGDLLTKHFRMQIVRRRFAKARRGTVRMQGVYRGHALRRVFASIKIQTMARMIKRRTMFRMLKGAVLALQCCIRVMIAKKIYEELRREQKDIGKLKQSNEKLKLEMASLKAMLAAQAQSASSTAQNQKELQEKQDEINQLERRIKALETELEKEKKVVEEMEKKIKEQADNFQKEKGLLEQSHALEMQKQAKRLSAVAVLNQSTHESPRAPMSPKQLSRKKVVTKEVDETIQLPRLPENYISPDKLAEHQAHIARLEKELRAERQLRQEANGEIIKLRATVNGVKLQDTEIEALAQKLDVPEPQAQPLATVLSDDEGGETDEETETDQSMSISSEITGSRSQTPVAPEVTGAEEQQEKQQQEAKLKQEKLEHPKTPEPVVAPTIKAEPTIVVPPPPEPKRQASLSSVASVASVPSVASVTNEVNKALNMLGIGPEAKDNRLFQQAEKQASRRNFLLKSPSEYLPMIRRGFARGAEAEPNKEVISVGWKIEVRNRKEREELLRDEVDRFEIKMKRFSAMLEEGIDVTMWQLSRKVELGGQEKDEFGLKSTAVNVQMVRRGEMYVQAVLTFSLRGGYLSKAIGRRKANKAALEPLSLYDILEVKAGCSGYDHNELPSSGKSKNKKGKGENRQSSLFLTIKATPTPEASFRSYIFKFKSRGARNDALNGLRSILADMQIHEGVSISSIHNNDDEDDDDDEIMVPLSEVHNAINREREAYDRLLLLLLQGHEDLKEKEDELLTMRGKYEGVVQESTEKDRVQANDSKLIMQLSKKLETLLMDNEDLKDQNDRLNARLVTVECEKMNLMRHS